MTTPPASATAQPRTIAWAVGAIAVACPLWAIHVWQARIMPPIATAAASLQSWMVLVLLLGSMLVGGWVLAAAWGVQHRRDPRHLCWAPAATVAWGAAVATGSAFRAQGWLGSSLARLFAGHSAGWVAAVMAPVTEEPAKALVIVLIMAVIPRTRTLIWGLILGLCTGLGFQFVEDGVYALRSALAHPASDVAGATGNAMARMFTSVWSHWLFSASMGVAIALLFEPSLDAAQKLTDPERRSALVTACSQILDNLAAQLRCRPRAGAAACCVSSYLAHGLWNLAIGAVVPFAVGVLVVLGCIIGPLLVFGLSDRR